jgi:hypothetical protein
VFQVSYAGNWSNHLQTEREINTTVPTFAPGDINNPTYPASTPRLNPNFAGTFFLEMNGNSRYDSLTVTLRKQSATGLQGQVFYTFSKAMDHNSGVSGSDSLRSPQAIMNPYDIDRDWGLADFHAQHNMVANLSYQLPVKVRSKFLGSVVNGWTLDGIGTFSAGMPFTPRLGASVSRDQASSLAERPTLRPGFSPNPTTGSSAGCNGFNATPLRTATAWYDACAFANPAAGTYGNLGRNTIIGPGLANVDLALGKGFFKAEMFNVLNHTNLGLPNTTAVASGGAANSSAGSILYTTTNSRQLQFALRVSF